MPTYRPLQIQKRPPRFLILRIAQAHYRNPVTNAIGCKSNLIAAIARVQREIRDSCLCSSLRLLDFSNQKRIGAEAPIFSHVDNVDIVFSTMLRPFGGEAIWHRCLPRSKSRQPKKPVQALQVLREGQPVRPGHHYCRRHQSPGW